MASIDKICNPYNFKTVNRVIVDRPSVAVNTIVNTNLPSGTINSSDVIGRNFTDSSLASFKLRIVAAIISCFAKSLKICKNSHVRSESCSLNCLPIDNSKSFTDKALLYFIMLNESFIPQKLKTVGTSSTKLSDPLVIVREEHNIALKFEDELFNNDHAASLKWYEANLSLPSSTLIP